MKLVKRIKSAIVGRFKQWTFTPYLAERTVAGEPIRFVVADLFGEGAYLRHETEWSELAWIKAHGIRSGDLVVDCGANHGFFTVLFCKWGGPTGRVIAFEPLEHNFNVLKRNLSVNGCEADCRRVALGSTNGRTLITTHPNATVVTKTPLRGRGVTEVAVRRLDDEMGEDVSVNFLKVDVEGFELDVLKGAPRVLAARPRLDLELHVFLYDDKPSRIEEIFEVIRIDRYDVYIQHEVDGVIKPFDRFRDTPPSLAKRELLHLFCR
jgi:FkbM family methyltransferase